MVLNILRILFGHIRLDWLILYLNYVLLINFLLYLDNLTMGYIERLLDAKQKEHVQCDGCHEMLVDPRTLQTCTHMFCFDCINMSMHNDLADASRCPVEDCKIEFVELDVIKLMLLIRQNTLRRITFFVKIYDS